VTQAWDAVETFVSRAPKLGEKARVASVKRLAPGVFTAEDQIRLRDPFAPACSMGCRRAACQTNRICICEKANVRSPIRVNSDADRMSIAEAKRTSPNRAPVLCAR
jgi:hypothetical protein